MVNKRGYFGFTRNKFKNWVAWVLLEIKSGVIGHFVDVMALQMDMVVINFQMNGHFHELYHTLICTGSTITIPNNDL